MAEIPVHVQVDTDAVVAKVLKSVHVDIERACAEVAEGIAKAIEAEHVKCSPYPGSARDKVFAKAAAIARSYTTSGPEAGHRDAAHPQHPGNTTVGETK